jgi:hypothetical protein
MMLMCLLQSGPGGQHHLLQPFLHLNKMCKAGVGTPLQHQARQPLVQVQPLLVAVL